MIRRRDFVSSVLLLHGIPATAQQRSSDNHKSWERLARDFTRPLFIDASRFSPELSHFSRASVFLDASASDSSAIIGLHGTGIMHALPPDLLNNPDILHYVGSSAQQARQTADRLDSWLIEETIRLRSRIAILVCQRSIARMMNQLAKARSTLSMQQVTSALRPQVILTPAMITAAEIAQHNGASYVVSEA